MKQGIQQLLLYRYRYSVTYALILVTGLAVLCLAINNLGPGLHVSEQASATTSSLWTWQNYKEGLAIVNLPYIALQKACISLLGLDIWTIRLASILLSAVTAIGFLFLMKTWHKAYAAMASITLFVASSWLIPIERLGTPLIMLPFVTVWLLLAASKLVRHSGRALVWSALFGIAAALSLYTPNGIWVLASIILVVIIHPEVRRSVGAMSGQQIALALFFGIPLLAPLAWGIYNDPQQARVLAGLGTTFPSISEFATNAKNIFAAIAWKAPELPYLRLANLPVVDIGTIGLFIAGTYRMARDWRSMRSQFTLIVFIALTITCSLSTGEQSYAQFIVPFYLVVASGVTVLFREWYKLFPRNPYARSFALLPIALFLCVILAYHYQRYFVAWASAPKTYYTYSNDISLIRNQQDRFSDAVLVVAEKDVSFYKLLSKKYPGLTVRSTSPKEIAENETAIISAGMKIPLSQNHIRIPLTNDDKQNSLRFWLVYPVK